MAAIDKFKKIFDQLTNKRGSQWLEEVPAWLGSHDGTVSTGTPGMIYVRTAEGQVLTVFNSVAPSEYNLLVKIGRHKDQPQLWQVIMTRKVWSEPFSTSMMYHHEQHEFPNPDAIFVDRKQVKALTVLVYDAAAFTVQVYGSLARTATGIVKIETQLVDLSAEAVTAGAVFVNIECDNDGVLTLNAGTAFGAPVIATSADIPVPAVGKYMIATVLLYEGQTTLSDDDIRVPFPLESGYHGDMTKAVYDTNNDGVVDEADNAQTLDGNLPSVFLQDAPSDGDQYARQDGAWEVVTAPPAPDTDAIHVNIAGEINGLTAKATPVAGDMLVIESAADGYAKRKVDVGNLPSGGGGATDFTDLGDVPASYTGQASKVVSVKADESGLEFTTPSSGGSSSLPSISGLILDLDPEQETFADNDPIATLTDQSGTGNNFTQATAGYKPLFKTNILGSLPCVRFDGTDDRMTSSLTLSNPFTIYLVYLTRINTGQKRILNGSSNWLMGPYSGSINYYNGGFIQTMRVLTGEVIIHGIIQTSIGANGFMGSAFMGANTNVGTPGTLGLQAGSTYEPVNCDVFRVLIWNVALTHAQHQSVAQYLESKYWA